MHFAGRDTNLALARLFEEIAQSLEVAGDQVHRLRAYRRAARSVAATSEPLELLAAEGRLREIPGIGPSMSALIAEYLETGALRTHAKLVAEHPPRPKKNRSLILKSAWETARLLVDLMRDHRASPACIEVAGEARRMCEMVSSIKLVAIPGEAGSNALIDLFEKLPMVVTTVERTAASAHVRLYDGVEISLYLTDFRSWGTALVRHTGSEAHRARLGELSTDESEEGVYRALGLPYIVPELREDAGEIEAARAGALLDLITEADLKGDLHCHTNETDGSNTLEEMALAARARGYAYMALTDHSRSLTITNGLSLERLEEARRRVQQVNQRLAPFTVLLGTEMDILEDGSLDYPDETLASLDYVSASVHNRFKQSGEAMTARILRAVQHPLVQTLNHPHGRLLGIRPSYAVDMPRVIEAAAAVGCAMEVSADPARMDLDGGWARKVRDAGGRMTISSDAHSTLDFDNIWLAIGSARRGWLTARDVLNTRPLPEFRELLRRPRMPPVRSTG